MTDVKLYTILVNDEDMVKDTLPNLIDYFSYTLQVGKAYQHEDGNVFIDTNPETADDLVEQLNNAVKNASANGCPSKYFTLL